MANATCPPNGRHLRFSLATNFYFAAAELDFSAEIADPISGKNTNHDTFDKQLQTRSVGISHPRRPRPFGYAAI
jgi:hypothetical protein